jgi:hypothetical protein
MTEGYYDDNFGSWHDTDEEEVREFYHSVQVRSVWKVCSICDEKVKLLPQYDKCNSCMDRMERGIQI